MIQTDPALKILHLFPVSFKIPLISLQGSPEMVKRE
jgi:hypothetical protein